MRSAAKRSAGKLCADLVRNKLLSIRLTLSRREAEAFLGPDGKRCRKCNPDTVDLSMEDEVDAVEGAQVTAGDRR